MPFIFSVASTTQTSLLVCLLIVLIKARWVWENLKEEEENIISHYPRFIGEFESKISLIIRYFNISSLYENKNTKVTSR